MQAISLTQLALTMLELATQLLLTNFEMSNTRSSREVEFDGSSTSKPRDSPQLSRIVVSPCPAATSVNVAHREPIFWTWAIPVRQPKSTPVVRSVKIMVAVPLMGLQFPR